MGYDNEVTGVVQRKRGAALEDAILDAAWAELSEVGYAAFSVEGVAARAHTGKASIYRRWPTRTQLLVDAVSSRLPTPAQCGFPTVLTQDMSTADALRQVACAIAELLNSPAGDVIRAVKCEAVTDPELARAIDDQFQAPRRAAMLALLRRGIERGEVRPGADTALIADVLPAVLTHRIVLQRQPISARMITEIIDEVVLPLIAPR